MIIGCDIDGVLANFNAAFIQRVIQVTGLDLFPPRPFDIPTWNYPEHYGYTADEVSAVWARIKADSTFWQRLLPYAYTEDVLYALDSLRWNGAADIYFITARPGVNAKRQTERWLECYGFENPTVLISSHKGLCAQALQLDAYIDDRWENCVDTAGRLAVVDWEVTWKPSITRTYLMNRPWNAGQDAAAKGIIRTDDVIDVCAEVHA